MPPTVNKAYSSIYLYGTMQRVKSQEMKKWARAFQFWSLENSPQVRVAKAQFGEPRKGHYIQIDCDFFFKYEQIFCLDGKVKKMDSSNRIKPIHDAISALIGVDDSMFFSGTFNKKLAPPGQEASCAVTLQWVSYDWF